VAVDVTRRKIAILGGGIGSLTAAYYLTRTEALRRENDVTIYQLGWRLGGKCASSRSLIANEAKRIEEHGLHLWFGFYENAFRMIREIYERKPALPDDRLLTWRDAFGPCSFTPIGEDYGGRLSYWPVVWPTNTDLPGDGRVLLTPQGALSELASLLRRVAGQLFANDDGGSFLDEIGDLIFAAKYSALLTLLEVLQDLSSSPLAAFAVHHGPLDDVLRVLRRTIQDQARERLDDPGFRRLYSVLEIGLTTLLGVLDPRYGIVTDPSFDLDRIDGYEYREWLLENGGDRWVVEDSSYLRALYDLPFAYEDGDIAKPSLGAGTAIRILLRIVLTYKEAAFFEMKTGMGEAVIAPIYEVLRDQGVKVELFRKVTRLELSPDERWISKVHMDRQVDILAGPYEPTFRVDGVTCWPSEPFWDQIVDGAAIKARLDAHKSSLESHWCLEKTGDETLELGSDYDLVVLGIALAGFKKLNGEPTMLDEVYAASPVMKSMAEGIGIVPTQSFQIWTKRDLRGLGWKENEVGPPAMNAAPEPYSVWADCSHVLARERWSPSDAPRGVFYFCGPWKNDLTAKPSTDASVPERAYDEVKANAIDWLSRFVGYMWPDARDPNHPAGLDWNELFDPQHRTGVQRMAFQFIRPNVDPTECCETSLPDTAKLRLKADQSGFENLVLAGAWLRTSINATCVEAATMSGMDAARAICGEPAEIVGEWFCMKPVEDR
jgi:uncharacterized protein with NAD-binding domain and iron-sulfur cluster